MQRRQHRRGSPLYITPAFELFPKSYDFVRKNMSLFAVLYIFPFIIGLSNGAWAVDSRRHWSTDSVVVGNAVSGPSLPAYAYGGFGIALLLAFVIAIVLQIMQQAAQLEASEGKKVSLRQTWAVAKLKGMQMFGLYVAIGLMLLISLLPLVIYVALGLPGIGAVVFLLPALLMLRRYYLAPYVLLESNDLTVWQVMEKSAQLSLKDSWSIYSLLGVMVLFSLFGVLPLLGWIIAFALHFFYQVAPAIRYRELNKLGN